MQEIISDFLLVSSSRYMEPLLFCTHTFNHTSVLTAHMFLIMTSFLRGQSVATGGAVEKRRVTYFGMFHARDSEVISSSCTV